MRVPVQALIAGVLAVLLVVALTTTIVSLVGEQASHVAFFLPS